MKKAVITTGGKQYLVSEGDVLDVELLGETKKNTFEPLLIIDNQKTVIGNPLVQGAKVTAETVEAKIMADKVVAIRYKAKKRVNKKRGHRQKLATIKITQISV